MEGRDDELVLSDTLSAQTAWTTTERNRSHFVAQSANTRKSGIGNASLLISVENTRWAFVWRASCLDKAKVGPSSSGEPPARPPQHFFTSVGLKSGGNYREMKKSTANMAEWMGGPIRPRPSCLPVIIRSSYVRSGLTF